eukprot:TRINITY_DN4534_c0_g1_i1.p1 TRINITY_DN4534_c0_g1~~TRINITY_DN4534_c0_g1_i1.p1  ORF type:complete len:572 (-),score=152.91 TRINITY_DN4534_c0_g1_i1:82-1797(-)
MTHLVKSILIVILFLISLSSFVSSKKITEESFNVHINIDEESYKKVEKSIPFLETIHSNKGPGNNVSAELRLNAKQLEILRESQVIFSSSIEKQVKRNELEYRLRGVKPKDDPTPNSYHTNQQMHTFLMNLVSEYPQLTKIETIGKSVNGVPLEVITIHDFNNKQRQDRIIPQFKYIANMHGDETVGRELMLSFALLLCQGFTNGEEELANLVKNVEISILPSMNPDGFASLRRVNANGYDLNRNFKDQYVENKTPLQPETLAVIKWSEANHFVLSANFHGGAVVANYPFDGDKSGRPYGNTPNYSPDQDTFLWLSLNYAKKNPVMSSSSEFPQGITNGAAWYPLYGGMQDWNYLWRDCFEITVELSDIKNPQGNTLAEYWKQNKESIINYLKKVQTGIRGRITDSAGNPLDATISVKGISKTVKAVNGKYFRMLSPGKYTIEYSEIKNPKTNATYESQTKEATTTEENAVYINIVVPDKDASAPLTHPSDSPSVALPSNASSSVKTTQPSSNPNSTDDTSSSGKAFLIIGLTLLFIGGVIYWAAKKKYINLPFGNENNRKSGYQLQTSAV